MNTIINITSAIFALVAYLWIFWFAYVGIMGIYRAHLAGRLDGFARAMSVPVVLLGYVLDVMANVTVAVLVFLDWPREWLVTTRLKRYRRDAPGTRNAKIAEYICEHLLDPFDPTGNHC